MGTAGSGLRRRASGPAAPNGLAVVCLVLSRE